MPTIDPGAQAPATLSGELRPGAVLAVIDGCRPDAIAGAETPNLQRLLREGTHTLAAQSVMPCITLPVHLSMVTSVPPEQHGVQTNTPWYSPRAGVVSVLDLAHEAGHSVAAFYNWEHLRALAAPGSLTLSHFAQRATLPGADRAVAQAAAQHLRHEAADLVFVYFGGLDETGHAHGWMSAEYLQALTRADRALGTVLDALSAAPRPYDLLLLSDHGGEGMGHGEDTPLQMTVPLVAWGPRVAQGRTLQGPVSVLDVAPTLAHWLGLTPAPGWQGRVVAEVLRA